MAKTNQDKLLDGIISDRTFYEPILRRTSRNLFYTVCDKTYKRLKNGGTKTENLLEDDVKSMMFDQYINILYSKNANKLRHFYRPTGAWTIDAPVVKKGPYKYMLTNNDDVKEYVRGDVTASASLYHCLYIEAALYACAKLIVRGVLENDAIVISRFSAPDRRRPSCADLLLYLAYKARVTYSDIDVMTSFHSDLYIDDSLRKSLGNHDFERYFWEYLKDTALRGYIHRRYKSKTEHQDVTIVSKHENLSGRGYIDVDNLKDSFSDHSDSDTIVDDALQWLHDYYLANNKKALAEVISVVMEKRGASSEQIADILNSQKSDRKKPVTEDAIKKRRSIIMDDIYKFLRMKRPRQIQNKGEKETSLAKIVSLNL